MKICIVGTGTMVEALNDVLRAKNLFTVDMCAKAGEVNEKIAAADAFILGVKPEDFEKFAGLITTDLSRKLAISIMPGVSVDEMQQHLKTQHVVRMMPNIALKVGKSVSGWFAGSAVGESEKRLVKEILQAIGVEFQVDREEKLDALNAVTGVGPSYFYFLMEVLEKAATKYGFTAEQGEKLASATLEGAMELLKKSGMSPREIREKLTVKGSATEAAFEHLKGADAGNVWLAAIEEAHDKAKGVDSSSFF